MTPIKAIENILLEYLKPYLSILHDYESMIDTDDNVVTIEAKRSEGDNGYFILLKIQIHERNEQIYLLNIYLPQEDRRQKIGMGLIRLIFKICQGVNYDLVLVNTTEPFKTFMLQRGAITTNEEDWLMVVETTSLE